MSPRSQKILAFVLFLIGITVWAKLWGWFVYSLKEPWIDILAVVMVVGALALFIGGTIADRRRARSSKKDIGD